MIPAQVPLINQADDDLSVVPAGWILDRGQVIGPKIYDGTADTGFFAYFFKNIATGLVIMKTYKHVDFDWSNSISVAQLNNWRRNVVRADPVGPVEVPDGETFVFVSRELPTSLQLYDC